MLGVGGDGEQCLDRGPEQDDVDHGLVLVGDVGDRCRQRKDQMIVGHRLQLGLAVGQPFLCRRALALGAMPIAAGVIGDVGVRARFAARNVIADLSTFTPLTEIAICRESRNGVRLFSN